MDLTPEQLNDLSIICYVYLNGIDKDEWLKQQEDVKRRVKLANTIVNAEVCGELQVSMKWREKTAI